MTRLKPRFPPPRLGKRNNPQMHLFPGGLERAGCHTSPLRPRDGLRAGGAGAAAGPGRGPWDTAQTQLLCSPLCGRGRGGSTFLTARVGWLEGPRGQDQAPMPLSASGLWMGGDA